MAITRRHPPTSASVDGRDLWSGRVIARHGNRLREPADDISSGNTSPKTMIACAASKQLCKTAPIPQTVEGVPVGQLGESYLSAGDYLSQGCLPTSLYSLDAFQVPNGYAAAYYTPLSTLGLARGLDVYASTVQSAESQSHRILSSITFTRRKTTRIELNSDYV